MSKPILYLPTETDFSSNGIGILNDCSYCMVVEELNGQFELEMRYPIDGIHYEKIVDRCIIKAKSNKYSSPQLFRVYSISKPMSGIVSVYAAHISYDLSGIPTAPFRVTNDGVASLPIAAIEGLKENAVINCPFTFSTNVSTSKQEEFEVKVPSSIRSRLLSDEDSILSVFGGEYEFDNFNVILHKRRGKDRGVSVRYGKNLRSIVQDRNSDLVYSGVYPFWVDGETGKVFELEEKVVYIPTPITSEQTSENISNSGKIQVLDFSSVFKEKPTAEQLSGAAIEYINENKINVPFVSLSVSFSQLELSEDLKWFGLLEKVELGDSVNVEFPALGVSSTSEAVQITYNVILDRIENVVLGEMKKRFTDSVIEGSFVKPIIKDMIGLG